MLPETIRPGGIDETHDRIAGDRLSGSRFADESHHLALAHVKETSSTALTTPAPREEVRAQPVDFEQPERAQR
jgi:hypothetical protein